MPKKSQAKPNTGVLKTGNQSIGTASPTSLVEVMNGISALPNGGYASGGGFRAPRPIPGDYKNYREMVKYPTISLVKSMVEAQILNSTWGFAKRGEGSRARNLKREDAKTMSDAVPSDWVKLISDTLNPLRRQIVKHSLSANIFGWAPAEMGWGLNGKWTVPTVFKPLLVDISDILVDKDTGDVVGVRNKPNSNSMGADDPIDIYGDNAYVFATEPSPGNPYGHPRTEDCRIEYTQARLIELKMAKYMSKVAGVIAQIHYPVGTSKDPSGADRSNMWIAEQLANDMEDGKTILLPNAFASADIIKDLNAALNAAGKSNWVIGFAAPPAGNHAAGFCEVLKRYDAQFFRAWHRPERTGLESQHGSRADAVVHSDSGTLDAEMADVEISEYVNQKIVNPILKYNFGADAVDSVYVDPAPIEDNSIQLLSALLDKFASNPSLGPFLFGRIDDVAILDRASVPVRESMRNIKFNPQDFMPAAQLNGGASGNGDVVGGGKSPKWLRSGRMNGGGK